MPVDRGAPDRLARIELMIEQYRERRKRELVQRAIKLWRQAEARQQVAAFDLPPERIH